MNRINARKCRTLVQSRIPFRGHGAIYGRAIGSNGYGVFSYGEHWPLHVWDGAQWHHNADKYSVTTSRHYGQSHPWDDNDARTPVGLMRALVARLENEPCN